MTASRPTLELRRTHGPRQRRQMTGGRPWGSRLSDVLGVLVEKRGNDGIQIIFADRGRHLPAPLAR